MCDPMTSTPTYATPLHYACSRGDIVEMKRLIREGGDVNATISSNMCTPLHIAVCGVSAGDTRVKAVRLLLDAGAFVNARGIGGVTALHCACAEGSASSIAVVNELIEAGADFYAATDNEIHATPYDITVDSEIKELLRDCMRIEVSFLLN